MSSHQAESHETIYSRKTEIHLQISDGNLKPALRRVHDFAADYGIREHQNEVVLLDARLSQMRREVRQFGISDNTSVERNKITNNVLSFIDEIIDYFESAHPESIQLEKTPPLQTENTNNQKGAANDEATSDIPQEPALATSNKPQADNTDDELHLDSDISIMPKPKLGNLPEKKLKITGNNAPEAPLKLTPRSNTSATETISSIPVFTCEDLEKDYSAFSLSEVKLELYPGQICGLVGINGSGKTTLLKMIAGELTHSKGNLAFPGLHPDLNWHAIRNQIAYVQQSPPTWYGSLEDNLTFVAAEHGLRGADNRAEVDRILYRLSLDDFRQHTWSQISGGYKMRFELARALLSQPRLLVLDEPLSPLDVLTQQLFLEDLRHLSNAHHQPMAVILSSQNLHEVEGVADQLLFLNAGKAIFNGSSDDLGKRFNDHLFELQVSGSTDDLEQALEPLTEPTVIAFGQSFHVVVPKSITGAQVIRAVLDANIQINHYRDISRSTRRLFDTQGD